jgi:hypothetical protein
LLRGAVAAIFVLVMSPACQAAPAATIEVYGRDGPTAVLVDALVKTYQCAHSANPVHMSTFPVSDSDAAVAQRVSKERGVVGFLGRHLKDVERDLAREEVVNPPAGGVAIAVSARTTLTGIASSDLADLFAGRLGAITSVATTPRGTQARDLVDRVVNNSGRSDAVHDVPSATAALQVVEQDEHSAAVVPLAAATGRPGIRVLTVDGIAPNARTIEDGGYPLRIWFALLLPLGESTPAAAAFVTFARTDEGSAALLAAYADAPRTGSACGR